MMLNPNINVKPIHMIFSCISKSGILSKFRNKMVVMDIEIKVADKTNANNFFCKLKKN
jgi:hypothetical protein